MRIGLFSGTHPQLNHDLQALASFAREAERRGFDSVWVPNIFSLDAIGACAIAGWETDHIELGTAVTPTYPRHPGAMAQQAMTTQAACGGRFTLGIGLSHQMVIEGMYGLSYDKPARHMAEYLQVLVPLLRGEATAFEGEQLTGKMQLDLPAVEPVPLLLAALGPAMLKLAGTMAHGTTTWMTGPKTIAEYIAPSISAAAEEAGHAAPRIVCGLPICLTDDVDGAREMIAKTLEIYGMLPSYRAMLDREGVAGPAELALVGDESTLRADVQRLRDAGVTDFNAAVIAHGDSDNGILDLLQSELPA
ncbi:TIGR03564 family F420-dependent LLM class oxidoreductase [Seongchinamella unica]|uniref:TIGR03564 family F420-dependent LLM class oxidoreductase n=1 Tax=Seongchinamella unica TaxID=2547392 RepID=A0A4V2ZX80_9GAMM|nr:TIGR03564 family F420-dependent LLM class oxidoreductase [Seongchinamella unica]TDG13624.1 TIGR03564 family F420-dependent LLM class oxidoreductase [Seongchinamella unica]